jgi:hypothetical protein
LPEVKVFDGVGGTLPTPGEYAFEVLTSVMGQSTGGYPQMDLALVVLSGADTDAFNGKGIGHRFVITDSDGSKGRVRCIADACGVAVTPQGFDNDHFVGKRFIGEVWEDHYDKDDLATGTKIPKTSTKIRKERPLEAGWSDATGAVAPAAAAPAVPPALPPPAAPAAPARALPPGPRVASPLPRPGSRPSVPGRRS